MTIIYPKTPPKWTIILPCPRNTTQIDAERLLCYFGGFTGGLAANNGDLENYLWLEFFPNRKIPLFHFMFFKRITVIFT